MNLDRAALSLCGSTLVVGTLAISEGCSSNTTKGPVAQSSARQSAPAPRRVIDPFAPASPALAEASATDTPLTPNAEPRGVTSTPSYDIFGNVPKTQISGVDESSAFDSVENVRRVSAADEGSDFDPSISPDGKLVYFASTRHRPTSDLYVKRVDGTAITQLTSDPAQDVMPAVSPDGSRVAFASNRNGSYDIYVISSTGGQAVQITSDPGQELRPTWSPDGKSLAFCRQGDRADRWEIWVADTRNPGAMKFLTFGLFPAWQPEGNIIAFQRSRERGDRYFSIWTVEYNGDDAENPTEIVSSTVAAAINPTWSPDGEYIAFSTVMDPERVPSGVGIRPSSADLWIVKSDGTSRSNLTSGSFANLSPAWGSDNRLYFVSNRSGADNLWSVNPSQAIAAGGGAAVGPRSARAVDVAPANGRSTHAESPTAEAADSAHGKESALTEGQEQAGSVDPH